MEYPNFLSKNPRVCINQTPVNPKSGLSDQNFPVPWRLDIAEYTAFCTSNIVSSPAFKNDVPLFRMLISSKYTLQIIHRFNK